MMWPPILIGKGRNVYDGCIFPSYADSHNGSQKDERLHWSRQTFIMTDANVCVFFYSKGDEKRFFCIPLQPIRGIGPDGCARCYTVYTIVFAMRHLHFAISSYGSPALPGCYEM